MASNRSSRHKQQTHLNFTPLPSSSPLASNLPEHVQNRAANIRYDAMASPTKKRRLASTSASVGIEHLDSEVSVPTANSFSNGIALPTPEPSSQVEAKYEDDHALSSSYLNRQSGSDEGDPESYRGHDRHRTRLLRRRSQKEPSSPSSDHDEERDGKFSTGQLKSTPNDTAIRISSSDESDVSIRRTPARKPRPNRGEETKISPTKPVKVVDDEDSDPVPPKYTPHKMKRQPESLHTPQNMTPTRSSTRLLASEQRRKEMKKSSRANLGLLSDPEESETGHGIDSSDSLMNELGTTTSKLRGDSEEDQDDSERSSEDAIRSPKQGRKLFRRKDSSPVTQIEDSESRSKHRGTSQSGGKRTGRKRAKRLNTEKSIRQKNLELLRQRRAGGNVQPSQDDELDVEGLAEDSQANLITLGEREEDSDPDRCLRGGDLPNLDEYEEDFVDDDSDTLGAPLGLDDIPLEFTRYAHKKPIEYFKDAVEWMIHNKLNPAFPRSDQVYTIARHKLDDVVQGFAGSKFISSAWKPEFLAALKKYPDVARIDIPKMFDQKCEACGRTGHPAKHQLVFSGKPYHRESLEDISSDDDSDDNKSYEEREEAAPHSLAFFLGRTCNANAETAHALHHWRHQLNHFVLDQLRAEGHTSPGTIIERENWSVKKREKYANKVVDEMEEDGRMKELYKEFKENIEAARDAKNETYSYGR